MPATLRSLRRTKDVTHSIPDLLPEHVHEISNSLFASSSPALASNARRHLLPEAGAQRRLEAVRCKPLLDPDRASEDVLSLPDLCRCCDNTPCAAYASSPHPL